MAAEDFDGETTFYRLGTNGVIIAADDDRSVIPDVVGNAARRARLETAGVMEDEP